MLLNEIFCSIQGEGINAGKPAIFVRFAGCNLKCSWCDTDNTAKKTMTEENLFTEILRLNKKHRAWLVVFTGGEPTLQLTRRMVASLLDRFIEVTVETNGTIYKKWFEVEEKETGQRIFTVSPKQGKPILLKRGLEIKVVNDGTWTIEELRSLEKLDFLHWFIQPCQRGKKINYKETADLVMRLGDPWRLSCQMHKIVGIR